MDLKCMLIVCLIIMALDGSVAKKRFLRNINAPVCLQCLDEDIETPNESNGRPPAERNQYMPHFIARLGLRKDYLPASCIACIDLLQMKGKSRNRPKINADSLKNPKRGTTLDQNFLFFRRQGNVPPVRRQSISTTPMDCEGNPSNEDASPLPMKASEIGANVNYHYHYHYYGQSTSGSDSDEESTDKESDSGVFKPMAAAPATDSAADSTTTSADSTESAPAVDSTTGAADSSESAPAADSTIAAADSSASAPAADSTPAPADSSAPSPAADATTAPAPSPAPILGPIPRLPAETPIG